MWYVETFLGSLSYLSSCHGFYTEREALAYKRELIHIYDFDEDYITIYYDEV